MDLQTVIQNPLETIKQIFQLAYSNDLAAPFLQFICMVDTKR
jgi:hypothetical protein